MKWHIVMALLFLGLSLWSFVEGDKIIGMAFLTISSVWAATAGSRE